MALEAAYKFTKDLQAESRHGYGDICDFPAPPPSLCTQLSLFHCGLLPSPQLLSPLTLPGGTSLGPQQEE